MRDTTFGEIVSRRFCLEYKACLKDSSLNKTDTEARFFAHTYETPGKKILKLEWVDAYDNIAFKRKDVTIPASAFSSDATTETQLVTLPESDKKTIEVTSSYDNAVLFYPMGQ